MLRRTFDGEPATRDIGPYKLAHQIAVGGMAEVFRALLPQKVGGDRAIVIKRLLPSLIDDDEQRAMFAHEAELGRRIDHPNVVAVLDHGVDGDAPYIVLEYVFGIDLSRLARSLSRHGDRLRIPLAVWLGTELLAGLIAVHEVQDDAGKPLEIAHRDVSPSNLFLSVHGEVKLGDLGIARAALFDSKKRGRAKGKTGYLCPEQVSGQEVDQRGDVFSAAVVIAELIMGRSLFAGSTEIGTLLAIRDGDISPLRALIPHLPVGLGPPIVAALARNPTERTASARALRDALLPFVTEPPQKLRAELGRLVVVAMDDEGEPADRTSLARTVEADARMLAEMAPALLTKKETKNEPLRETGPLYTVERDGKMRGPFALAELVRAITTGEVQATDFVRADDDAPRTIANVPELARHLPSSTRDPSARRRTQMSQTNELYDLGARSVLAVLMDVLAARDDGLLLCESGGNKKEVYLEKGVPVFVTSNQPDEMLGEMLVKSEVIDRAELDMALALMPRFEGRLGETLVALGFIDPMQLFSQINDQVKEKLFDVFLWTQGHAALYRGVPKPERAFPLRLDPWEIMLGGAARRIEAGLENARFDNRQRDALEQTTLDVESFALPERLLGAWLACRAPRALGEIEGFAPTAVQARATVLVLLELGALRWRGRS